MEHGGRTVRVRPLPIGIPFERFVQLAQSAPKVISSTTKIVLGVDRLDYTKGLVHRLRAFEMLLEKHPEHREKVRAPFKSWLQCIFMMFYCLFYQPGTSPTEFLMANGFMFLGNTPSDIRSISHRCQRVPRAEGRDGPIGWPYQWTFYYTKLVPHKIYLWLCQPR